MTVYTWPLTAGSGGGTPAGSTGQIQFNDAGAFGADSNLHWDNTNKRLGVGTASPAAPLEVSGYLKFSASPSFGSGAGAVNTSGINAFFGTNAGNANTSGAGNTYFGYEAGKANTTANNGVYIGYRAGTVSTGASNVGIGANCLLGQTTGSLNIGIGTNALRTLTTATRNAVVGPNAGYVLDGNDNAFFGNDAGRNSTTGTQNACIGGSSGYSMTTGNNNLMLASRAGYGVTTGSTNVCIGVNTMYTANGSSNAIFGANAGRTATAIDNNVIIGYQGARLSTGILSGNVIIGYNASYQYNANDELIITNRNHSGSDDTQALLYGTFASTPGSQSLRVNGAATLNYGVFITGGTTLDFSTENVFFSDAGSTGATEQDWIEVTVGGVTGYIRVYATK